MDRRQFNHSLALAGVIATAPAISGAALAQAQQVDAGHDASRPFHIGMIIYDGMTLLDFAGPADIWSRPPTARVFVLAKSREPVTTDTKSRILPDLALGEAPELDLLFIGGGIGVAKLMEDAETLEFLKARAPNARWITSVCTGALVLGAAGLLRGYKAATHWASMDLLPLLGAEPVESRVVMDRNRITGGGVTAGIDFGLIVAQILWGQDTAELLQLGTEYDPHPPFNSGSPVTARPAIVERFRRLTASSANANRAAALMASSAFDRLR